MWAIGLRLNLAVLAAVVLPQVVGLDIGNAAAFSGSCATNQTTFTVSTITETSITSGGFVDLPDTVVNFVQGNRAGCIVVTFSAEAFAGAGVVVTVRPVLDDNIFAVPRQVRFVSDSPNEYDAHAMTFIFRVVEPGSHQIKMQIRGEAGRVPEIGVRSTVVQHLK